jgi:hypothetical protein
VNRTKLVQDRVQGRGSCEHGNEPLGSINRLKFLNQLSNYLKKELNGFRSPSQSGLDDEVLTNARSSTFEHKSSDAVPEISVI